MGDIMTNTNNYRLYERIAGIGYLLATLCYSIGSGMVEGALINSDNTGSNMTIGIFLELLNSIFVVVIGAMLYLRFKSLNQKIALGYLISRIAEGVLLALGSFSGSLHLHNYYFNLAMLVLGLYSVFFFAYLIRISVDPKWLLVVGVIGYFSLLIYSGVNLVLGYNVAPMWLFGPGAVFEILFPIRLIMKGLDTKIRE